MISHAFVRFEDGGIARDAWDAFCARHGIEHAPEAAGGNVYYHGGRHGIECLFGGGDRHGGETPQSASEVTFVSPWGGPRIAELATLARAFWIEFGGAMYADEEMRRLICQVG